MPTIYNAAEIFQIGIEIEKNGLEFYRACASGATDPAVATMCDGLADWETQHVELFEGLRAALPEGSAQETVFDPGEELPLYLKAVADSHIFFAKNIASIVSEAKTAQDILSTALTFEKDSVVLYAMMEKMVPENLGKKEIERLINEEIKHIAIITDQMAALKK